MTELKCPKCGETEAIYYYFAEKIGIKCGNTNCGYEIKDCESVEEAEFKWKSKSDPKALRPCPFCKAHGDDVYVDEFWERYDEPYFVTCHGCGACGPYADTEEKAIEYWNRRASDVSI